MKIAITGLGFILAVVILFLLKQKSPSNSSTNTESGQQMLLEQKLAVLSSCGIELAEPFNVNELLTSWGREDFEKEGFDLVLVALGMTEEKPPWRNHCVNLWHFDTECIEDHGDYKRIAKRMSELTEGSMNIENIQDYVDVDKEKAWLSFTSLGKELKIDCEVDNDWVDTNIFGKFQELLNAVDQSKIYIYGSTPIKLVNLSGSEGLFYF